MSSEKNAVVEATVDKVMDSFIEQLDLESGDAETRV